MVTNDIEYHHRSDTKGMSFNITDNLEFSTKPSKPQQC